MKNKRGVSPLLAAVLLIAFSIALGAIVSKYILEKTQEFNPEDIAQESVYCESVSIGYKVNEEIFDETTENGVELLEGIILVNRGAFSIHQLIITAPGVPSIRDNILIMFDSEVEDINIDPGENYTMKIQFDSNYPNKNIKIVPVIKDLEKNQLVQCPDRQLVINYESICEDLFSETEGFDSDNPCDFEG